MDAVDVQPAAAELVESVAAVSFEFAVAAAVIAATEAVQNY